MARGTVTQKLIESHAGPGSRNPGSPVALKIDQTLLQDATGTLVVLELLSLGIERVTVGLAAQYVDHNLVQADSRNPDDHVFLQTASQRLGVHFSRPGNGVSHPVHMARFAKPGETLLGSDSHTCASGSMGMLAIGSGGLDVAMAMAGEPYHFKMPEICGVHLTGSLPDWVSAKDVILELLRRRGVAGGRGKVFEYFGPGLTCLSAMDRHVIANMGAELGALTSVFPSDGKTRDFLAQQGRATDWKEILPDEGARYDAVEEIDLSGLEPLIARPSSPDNVVPVHEVEGEPIYQAYVGSSANPGFRDFAVAAEMLKGRQVHPEVSFDVSPTSREILENLIASGHLLELTRAGARVHQAGCNGCIGMGQAPATGKNSLRTTPRNFPGRSGTVDDRVWLCSPETATASAISGRITDPRHLKMPYPKVKDPIPWRTNREMILSPLPTSAARKVEVIKGPNIKDLVHTPALIDRLHLIVALKVGDNVSTDEILPAGARALPFRSNIEKISEFAFIDIDPDYAVRAKSLARPHAIVAGENYGQGSSREHAALALVFLGLRAVIAKSYARIHFQNLVNFGVVPFTFKNPGDYERLNKDDGLQIVRLKEIVRNSAPGSLIHSSGPPIAIDLAVSDRQREILIAGGLINWKKERMRGQLSPGKPA